MSRFWKNYLLGLSLGFTIVILTINIDQLLRGNHEALYIVQLAGYFIVIGGLDALISLIPCKSFFMHFMISTLILYIPTILFAYLFHWFPMTLKGVIINSLYYCIVMMIVHFYIYKSMQREADEINQLLNRKDE